MPKFSLFTSEDDQSTQEHVNRFIALCGDTTYGDFWKLRLFPLSLSKTTFTWYTSLPSNSIFSWDQMETMFHNQFQRVVPDVSITDLSAMKQHNNEPIDQFMFRLKKARNRCLIPLSRKTFA